MVCRMIAGHQFDGAGNLNEAVLLENIDDRSPYLLLSDEALTFVRQSLCIVLISPHPAEIVLVVLIVL
jgi:hypothetical protein